MDAKSEKCGRPELLDVLGPQRLGFFSTALDGKTAEALPEGPAKPTSCSPGHVSPCPLALDSCLAKWQSVS